MNFQVQKQNDYHLYGGYEDFNLPETVVFRESVQGDFFLRN